MQSEAIIWVMVIPPTTLDNYPGNDRDNRLDNPTVKPCP